MLRKPQCRAGVCALDTTLHSVVFNKTAPVKLHPDDEGERRLLRKCSSPQASFTGPRNASRSNSSRREIRGGRYATHKKQAMVFRVRQAPKIDPVRPNFQQHASPTSSRVDWGCRALVVQFRHQAAHQVRQGHAEAQVCVFRISG